MTTTDYSTNSCEPVVVCFVPHLSPEKLALRASLHSFRFQPRWLRSGGSTPIRGPSLINRGSDDNGNDDDDDEDEDEDDDIEEEEDDFVREPSVKRCEKFLAKGSQISWRI